MSEVGYVLWRYGAVMSILIVFLLNVWALARGTDEDSDKMRKSRSTVGVEFNVSAWFYDLPVLHPCVPYVLDTVPGRFSVNIPIRLEGELKEGMVLDSNYFPLLERQLEDFFQRSLREWYNPKNMRKKALTAYRGYPEELQRSVANLPVHFDHAGSFLQCFQRILIRVGKPPNSTLGICEL